MIQLKSGKTWSQLYSFELISFDRQMATFADNSVAIFFFQAEDGIRDSVASRGLGDVYKRQAMGGWKQIGTFPPTFQFCSFCSLLLYLFDKQGLDAMVTVWLTLKKTQNSETFLTMQVTCYPKQLPDKQVFHIIILA